MGVWKWGIPYIPWSSCASIFSPEQQGATGGLDLQVVANFDLLHLGVSHLQPEFCRVHPEYCNEYTSGIYEAWELDSDGPHICSTLWCSQVPTRGRVGENNDGGWPYLEPKGVPLHCNWSAGVFSGCIGSRGNQILTCLAQTMSWSWKFFQCMRARKMRGCIANIYNLYSTCTTQAIGHTPSKNPNEPTSNWSGIPIRVFDRAHRRSSNRSFRSWGSL